MPRNSATLPIAVIGLALCATLGWFKWNEGASESRLRELIAEQIRNDVDGYFADCDLTGLRVTRLTIDHTSPPLHIEGEITVPRRRFATLGAAPRSKHYFEPTGTGTYKFVGITDLSRENFLFFGRIHPAWEQPYVMVSSEKGADWADLNARGANSLFDMHFANEWLEDYTDAQYRDVIRPYARPVLRQTGRLDESAALWALEWTGVDTQLIRHEPVYMEEAKALIQALEKAGPSHAKSLAFMRALIKKKEK